MALTVKGFQGTIGDADMATQLGAHHLPTVRGAGDLAVTAVAGARTVNVAAGVADAAFSKVTNDGAAAGNIALAPPASGGKWYAVTVNRQWSPSNTVTLQADDLGVSDTNGTVPTSPPVGVLNAAAGLPNLPGTSGSTAGQRQVLALVYVRAADTTLTIFDMRFRRTGAGVVTAANFWALFYATAAAFLTEGATVAIAQHTLPSGGLHVRSVWERSATGYWNAVGRIVVNDATATQVSSSSEPKVATNNGYIDSGHSRGDLATLNGLGAGGISLERNTELFDVASGTTFRWNPIYTSGRFYPWDSPWFNGQDAGFDVAGGTWPRYLFQYQIGFRAGRARYRGTIVANAACSFSYLQIGIPSPLPQIEGTGNQQGGMTAYGEARALNASDGYRGFMLRLIIASSTIIKFRGVGQQNSSNTPGYEQDLSTNYPFGEQWTQSDTLQWEMEYDIAA